MDQTIKEQFGDGPYKLHLGCGWEFKPGYINIDFVQNKVESVDLIADVRKLPFEKESCSEILSFHLIEHIKRPDVKPMLKHWFDLLIPTGRLILELPNFDEIIYEYMLGKGHILNHVFGNQDAEGQIHYWGYNFKRLKNDLEEAGFKNIINLPATDYHTKDEPCFRVEAEKC